MIIPIRCFTCGKVLADKYEYFVEKGRQREKEVEAAGGEATAKYKHFDAATKGDILNDLGLTRYCCRRHLLAQVDMMDTI
jgi:DNA-directed RNA polymerase subunit N (RpoN/RPB10)